MDATRLEQERMEKYGIVFGMVLSATRYQEDVW